MPTNKEKLMEAARDAAEEYYDAPSVGLGKSYAEGRWAGLHLAALIMGVTWEELDEIEAEFKKKRKDREQMGGDCNAF